MDREEGGQRPQYRYRFGTAEFDEARIELRVNGLAVDLEQKPLQLLAELLRRSGEVVTREELFESVWAGRVTVDNVLANAVAKLRKALGAEGERIVTQPRVGYRLSGPVERVAVGRRLVSGLNLRAGDAVTGREHYRLECQLGQSRGSEVWLSRHDKTREPRVFKFSADGERLPALKREATIYRVLLQSLGERSDFARVLDWNFEQPPFFLECEYAGQNLQQWAEDNDRLRGLSNTQRLALFLQIADAVAAAHSVGVLHKDIKPANVLVRSAGSADGWQAALTDFGSGRLLEPGRLEELGITQLGLTITQSQGAESSSGTPLYLAPELIAGQAPTVQSDVYALGYVLYQLMSGDLRKPMAPGWEHDITDSLLAEDIACATDGHPERRLSSVAELASRLRSLEARRAEVAREKTDREAATRLKAELERGRARRPWIVAAMVAMLAGSAASLWLYLLADRARAEAQRQTALARAAYGFLRDDIVGAIDPARSGKVGTTIQEAVNRVAPRVDIRFSAEPEVQVELYRMLGLVNQRTVAHEAALQHYAKALQIAEQRYGEASEQVVALRAEQVLSFLQLSRFDEAKASLERAERDFAALSRPLLATAYEVHTARGHYETHALNRWNEAVEAYTRAISAAERDPDFNPARLLGAYSQKGTNLARADRMKESLELLVAAQDRAERLSLLDNAVQLRIQRLGALVKAQRFDEALALAEETQPLVVEVRGPESGWLSDVTILRAYLLDEMRRGVEAGEAYDEAAAARQRLLGPDNVYVIEAQRYAGWAYRTAGDEERALARLGAAHAAFRRIVGDESPYTHLAALMYALSLLDVGRYAEAERMLAGADPSKAEQGDGLAALINGRLALQRGRKQDARAALERAATLLNGKGDRRYAEEARRELTTLGASP
jgi:eukaryotic-like serine/threonine-protein kinase